MILMTPELSGEVSTLRNHLLHVIRPEKSRSTSNCLSSQCFFRDLFGTLHRVAEMEVMATIYLVS